MELENQSAINPLHKSCPIKLDQPSIAWIKFITPSSSLGPSLECPVLESVQISWIGPLSVSLIFLDLALVIGPTGTYNGSFNACWFSSKNNKVYTKALVCYAHAAEEERNRQNRGSEVGDSLEVTQKGAHMEFDFGWQNWECD